MLPKPLNSPNYDLFYTILRVAVAAALFASFWIFLEINQAPILIIEPNRLILGLEIWLFGVLFAWQIWEVFRYR